MTELGHGSNVRHISKLNMFVETFFQSLFYWVWLFLLKVRGIETIATYDINTGEFVINTPCESAQKYWIGGAANVWKMFVSVYSTNKLSTNQKGSGFIFTCCMWHASNDFFNLPIHQHATHTIIFSQLLINGTNQGVHAFIAQIRDSEGNICPNVRIADCGHKIGLNGVDNGRIWWGCIVDTRVYCWKLLIRFFNYFCRFDNIRIPRENLLNSVADVLPDGQYFSSIKDPDQVTTIVMIIIFVPFQLVLKQ